MHEEVTKMKGVSRHHRLRWPLLVVLAGVMGALCWTAACRSQTPGVPGDLTIGGSLSLRGFRLGPNGVLQWPKLRISQGGGEGSGPSPTGGQIHAQPGGSLVIQPLGDYRRSAIDLLPIRRGGHHGPDPWQS